MKLKRVVKILSIGVVALLATSCQKTDKEDLTVLIRMMPAQQRYFKNEILPQFEKLNNCKVNLRTFYNASELKRMLELDAKKQSPDISLVKVPFEVTQQLVVDKLVKKLSDVVDSSTVERDMAIYHPVASALAMQDGEFYYIPRKLETRVLFYRKSMVADATSKLDSHRDRINGVLKALNGFGLPLGYELETDANEWDVYDLFVIGSIWANEEYNGTKNGRIAHRGAKYEGTTLFMLDRAYQLGATPDDIRRMSGDAVNEMFLWESIFVNGGLYNSGMWDDPWRGSQIYTAVKDGKAFMAWFQQIDLFNIHGWDQDPGMPGYIADENDMGIAVIPQAVSFTLNQDGKPEIEGSRKITTGGWWWGIPEAAPKDSLAYKLAKFITNKDNNAKECSQFGMIPVRKDLLLNLQNVFSEGWVGDIYKTSVAQINLQLDDTTITIVPQGKNYPVMADNYNEAWYSVVEAATSDNAPLTLDAISQKIEKEFIPQEKKIFGEDYPELVSTSSEKTEK
jgi:ABC-type glycerol-3-phosphate transport system substrate-binding protein